MPKATFAFICAHLHNLGGTQQSSSKLGSVFVCTRFAVKKSVVAPATGDPFLPAHAWKSTMRLADAIYSVPTAIRTKVHPAEIPNEFHPAASPSGEKTQWTSCASRRTKSTCRDLSHPLSDAVLPSWSTTTGWRMRMLMMVAGWSSLEISAGWTGGRMGSHLL